MRHEQLIANKRWSRRMWWPLGTGLSVMVVVGCGGNEVEVKRAPPPPPPPPMIASVQMSPGIRPPPTCAELGIPNEPDRVFEHEGKYCGCHEGKAHCRDTNDKCFHDGVWFEKGAWFYEGNSQCKCESPPVWSCYQRVIRGLNQVTILNVIEFEVGSAKLPANADFHIQRMIEQLRSLPNQPLTLEAHAALNEPEPEKIAQNRAETVRAVLVKRGVKSQKIVIKNLDTKPVSFSSQLKLDPGTDVSALNTGAKIIYWVGDLNFEGNP